MPGKLCCATLLVLSLLSGEGGSQEFVSSTFGKELIQPPVHMTPDRSMPSVQQAGYSEPSVETPSNSARSSGATEPLDDRQSGAALGRDLRFPTWEPSGKPSSGGAGAGPSTEGLGSVVTVISSLAVVLGLFFMTAWLMRRTGRGGFASLPEDVFEVLGRAPLNHRQQVHLVRCGTKFLLVSLTPDSAETLTEIDDPDEVTRLAGLCKARQTGSASVAFRQVLHQFAGQPAEPGFIGRSDSQVTRAELPSELENHHG